MKSGKGEIITEEANSEGRLEEEIKTNYLTKEEANKEIVSSADEVLDKLKKVSIVEICNDNYKSRNGINSLSYETLSD